MPIYLPAESLELLGLWPQQGEVLSRFPAGLSALAAAAWLGDEALVAALLAAGAHPDAPRGGWHPLAALT